jgi:TPR repeat protein
VIDSLSRDEIDARLSGSPEERALLIREGAEAGVAEAQAVWAQMLLDGDEEAEAFAWFNKAAAQGHLMALNMVGRCYDLGWGVAADKGRATECFRVAAERGLDWAMYNYATALALGEGVAEDRPAALAWFEQAAALGNAKAINHVGSFHEDGWVVERDLAKAAEYYARAADGGDFRGQFNHARMLLAGGRVDEARGWLAKSAETATPAFREKATAWLAANGHPDLSC